MQKKYLLLGALFLLAIGALFVSSRYLGGGSFNEQTFIERCLFDGNMWHVMAPLRQGKELGGEKEPGCMTADGANHFSDYAEYKAAKYPGESDITVTVPDTIEAGERVELLFTARTPDGGVPELFREHERYLHVIIISADMVEFSHIHPDDQPGFSDDDVKKGEFTLPHVFERAGTYLIAVDYANKLKHESRKFTVSVHGAPPQAEDAAVFSSQGAFSGYDVALSYPLPLAGRDTALTFAVEKDGKPVADMVPYLAAAMHVAVVKNDISEFIHAHGEVHPPGYVQSSTHVHTPPPSKFGPNVEAHVIFPSQGTYTVFAEFKHEGKVIPSKFTVRVEE